ncbi:MAG: transglutaminase-like domain-containing protein [Planctomycetota bacterium]|nr:transglutaminase-like domain-containing protein [Planctomycetota bacterium]
MARSRRGRYPGTVMRAIVGGVMLGLVATMAHPSSTPGGRGTTVASVSDGTRQTERWFRCTLGGVPCGHARETVSVLEDGGLATTTEIALKFLRENTETRTRIVTETVSDTDGRPRSMRLQQEMGGDPLVTEWTFRADDVLERRSQGGRAVQSERPLPAGEWHLPDAAWSIARRRATESEPVRVRVLDPLRGLEPSETTFRLVGETEFRGPAGRQTGVRWLVVDEEGTETREIHSRTGDLLRSEVDLGTGLGVLRIELASKAIATGPVDAPIQLMEAGLVRPVFQAAPRRLDRGGAAVYRVRRRDGSPMDLPSIGSQRVRSAENPSTALVLVDPDRSSAASGLDPMRYLEPTALLDSDDPAVVAFAKRHDRADASGLERARGLRRAVHRHIDRKDLGTAFATAGETVRSRGGDCSEHAVLLAAGLRALGIPSRTVSGLVWTPRSSERTGAFLWHMWTQALVDGRWCDLDATLPAGRDFHPGHLAISASDGGRADLERNARAMLQLFGAIEIEVQPADFEWPRGDRE